MVLCWSSIVFADSKLSALSNNSSPTGTDLTYDVASGTSYNITLSQVKDFVLTANVGIGSASPGQSLDVQGTVRAFDFMGAGTDLTGTAIGLSIGGNSATATALAANPTNCSAGNYPLGVDASGNSESCTVASTGTVTSVTLSTPSSTLTLGGTNPITTSGTISADINLTHANTWTGQQIFNTSNVGINSTTPGERLDVQGTIRTTGFTLTTGATNGYILTSDTNGKSSWAAATVSSTPGGSATNLQYQVNSTTFGGVTNSSVVSGNIGLNSANPGQILDIQGTIRATGFTLTTGATNAYVLTSSATGVASWAAATSAAGGTNAVQYNSGSSTFAGTENKFSFNGTNVGIGTTSGINLLDVQGTVTANAFQITGQGNVGIGTASPQRKFDVTSSTSPGMRIYSTSTSNPPAIEFKFGNSATNVSSIGQETSTTTDTFCAGDAVNDFCINSGSNQLDFATGNSLRMKLVGANFGINQTAPKAFLDVSGNAIIGSYSGTNTAPSNGVIISGNVGIGTYNPSSLFEVGVQKFNVFSGGNIGVGSITPGQTLDVNGTVRAITFINRGGTSSQFQKADGSLDSSTYSTAVGANPTGTVGTAAVNGSSANFIRADGAPAINLTMSPTWTGNHIFAPSSGNTVFTAGNVGIGSASPGQVLDVQGTVRVSLNVGIGTVLPSQALTVNGGINTYGNTSNSYLNSTGGNVGIGSVNPGTVLDVQGTIRTTGFIINTKSTTGIGWSEHNAANQACNTTCGTTACVIGLDAGTVGVLNSNFVACTDATADDCICAGP